MLAIRSRRAAALLSVTALGVGTTVAVAPAQAQLNLGNLLPGLGTILNPGQLLGGLVPGAGGVTGVTGTAGGLLGGLQETVTGLVDSTLGGVLGGNLLGGLPIPAVNNLLGTLLSNSTALPATPGIGSAKAGAPIVLAGGKIGPGGAILDASPPRATVKVLSKLKAIGQNGKMRMQVKTDEPGVIAVAGRLRPGAKFKQKGAKGRAARAKHSRKLIKVPRIVLGYRQAGKLTVNVQLSRAAQRALGASRDAKMSVGTVAVDLFRNQSSDSAKLNIKR